MDEPRYVWKVNVCRRDAYGKTIPDSAVPVTIIASTQDEVIEKARVLFGAVYDDFRGHWDYYVRSIVSVDECLTS